MKIVADKLNEIAQAENAAGKPIDGGLFVKSACNRYYYASYLSLRDFLFENTLADNSKRLEHDGARKCLQGSAKQKILAAIKLQEIPEHKKSVIQRVVQGLCNEIASNISDLYEVRRAVDYDKETKVTFNSDGKAVLQYLHKDTGRPVELELGVIESKSYKIAIHSQEISKICEEIGLK